VGPGEGEVRGEYVVLGWLRRVGRLFSGDSWLEAAISNKVCRMEALMKPLVLISRGLYCIE
jgi:hypothetical protein